MLSPRRTRCHMASKSPAYKQAKAFASTPTPSTYDTTSENTVGRVPPHKASQQCLQGVERHPQASSLMAHQSVGLGFHLKALEGEAGGKATTLRREGRIPGQPAPS
jgi:hypothetical protein